MRLGRAIAEALGDDGFDLVIHCNQSTSEATALAKEMKEMDRRAKVIRADLSREKQVLRLAKQAEQAFGGVDVLVNSAAIYHPTAPADLTGWELDAFLDVNLKAPYLLASTLAPKMKKRGQGQIINIDCLTADKPWATYIPYSISKAALRSCTLGMAQLFAPEVRVNGIAPGTVLPPEDTSAKERKMYAQRTLLRRIGSAQDIVAAVRYLVTAEFVTGEILTVDGGRKWKSASGS